MPDVTIPADVAKDIAASLRINGIGVGSGWADLLDPRPPSLREQVAIAAAKPCAFCSRNVTPSVADADAVLAVVADWLAAYDLGSAAEGAYLSGFVRAIDLLRGEDGAR